MKIASARYQQIIFLSKEEIMLRIFGLVAGIINFQPVQLFTQLLDKFIIADKFWVSQRR